MDRFGTIPFKCTIKQFLSNVKLTNDDRDVAFVYLKQAHIHADFTTFFVKKNDVQYVKQSTAQMPLIASNQKEPHLNVKYTNANTLVRTEDVSITVPEENSTKMVKKIHRNSWVYDIDTDKGDCGAPLIVRNVAINPGKVIGIHFAGSAGADASGNATPIYYEDVTKICKEYDTITVEEKQLQMDTEHPYKNTSLVYLGNGKTPTQVTESKITKSIFYNNIEGYPPKTIPCTLNRSLINGEWFYPMKYRMEKYGSVMKPLDENMVSLAAQGFNITLNNVIIKSKALDTSIKRPLTWEETICGIDARKYVPALKRSTSTGYPYCMDPKTSSRKVFFGYEDKPHINNIHAQNLIKECEKIEQDIIEYNKIPMFIFVDTIKDERKPIHKAHKSRVFSNGPLNYLILCKKYYNPILELIQLNRNKSKISVGTNPYSMDWHEIATELLAKSPNMIAGDFEGFDSSQHSSILEAVFDILVKLSKELLEFSDNDCKIMRTLGNCMVNSYHCHEGKFFQWTHGMVSGSYFTAVINSIFVNLVFCMAFMKSTNTINLNQSVKFWQECGIVAYGDDHVVSVPLRYQGIFDQLTIGNILKEFGLSYTMEEKDAIAEKPFRSLEEISYLKRNFRFDNELKRYVGPLSLDTIIESPQWVKKGPDTYNIAHENLKISVRELSLHSQEIWDEYHPKFIKTLTKYGDSSQFNYYERYPTLIETIEGEYF
jgi:hypothetical protein